MNEQELGWISGILDGEGTITICRIRGFMRPIVQVVNTNTAMMLKVQKLLSDITGRTYSILRVKRYSARTLECYRIQVVKQADIEMILNAILPALVAKAEQARLVLGFLEIRKNILRRPRTGMKGGQHRPYSDSEEAILSKVKILNNYRTRRDYTPESLKCAGDKI